ncbi:DUF3102 domain-containing protein [Mesorhizobium sp. M2D.F.Ca.ET.223.01.1.1]|uniref:DUF3102 domain-containing protein n=1 Tax=Mesorhizobium sp. M2D.F.Ca.ET.223.01.1.1 TaxID=2563940 RepID=UPI001092C4CD|nr:DUF3102 domain-containing protein [Mesorhizobium sp. M2D.F.Ca.ET.223.01.1.1]TGP86399.1 DUF3102 domain-containing protein [bacterium M00.F.Ca.ET.221.01.1.1]TGR88741.1 DUF3102 domain-containing protein [Mesorhizobium sp. M2D.F.Ca.ET.223.01.1.1]
MAHEDDVEDLDLDSNDLAEVDKIEVEKSKQEAYASQQSTSCRAPIYNEMTPALAKQAEEVAGRIRGHRKSMRGSQIEIGKELIAIKDQLGRGRFCKWLEAEFEMSHQTACNYMNVASVFAEIDIGIELGDSALALLAAPSADDVRSEVIAEIKADMTKAFARAPTVTVVKQKIEAALNKSKAAAAKAPAKAGPATTNSSTPAAVQSAAAATPTAGTQSKAASVKGASVSSPASSPSTSSSAASPARAAPPAAANSSPEAKAAAASLVKMLSSSVIEFARLYKIAGHQAFGEALSAASKEAERSQVQHKAA